MAAVVHLNQINLKLAGTTSKEADNSKVTGGILAQPLNKYLSKIPASQPVRQCFHPGASVLSREALPLNSKPPVTGIEMIQGMLQYIWPKDDKTIRDRVKLAVYLLVGAKVANITVPFIFKYAVDYLNAGAVLNMDTAPQTAASVLVTILIGLSDGIARASAAGFNELRNAVFAKVAQHSIRKIAKNHFIYKDKQEYRWDALEFMLFFTLTVTQWRTKFRIYMNQAENEAGNKAIDSLINFETVKYFNNEKFEADRYDKVLKKYEDASLKTSTSLAMLNFGQNAIFSAGLSAIMILAANEIVKGNMTIGDLVMGAYTGGAAVIDRHADHVYANDDGQHYKDSKTSSIKFENVYFEYLPGKDVLKGLDLTIEPEGVLMKSTLVRLLYRFYEPNQGRILIGDQDIRNVDLTSLRKAISIVPQDSVLFHDTIKHNLHYGNLRASEQEVIEAARLAEIHETIIRWPSGYNTQVGERGLKLSGGEKQRVAIARAILKNSPILIFDEATSSLDSITEHNILKALRNATLDRTSICIAHRLSTIMDADVIYVIENGRVTEKGSHDTLIRTPNSLYRKLWETQNNYQQYRASAQNFSFAFSSFGESTRFSKFKAESALLFTSLLPPELSQISSETSDPELSSLLLFKEEDSALFLLCDEALDNLFLMFSDGILLRILSIKMKNSRLLFIGMYKTWQIFVHTLIPTIVVLKNVPLTVEGWLILKLKCALIIYFWSGDLLTMTISQELTLKVPCLVVFVDF
ncbi:hypothetical protein NQ317_002416 [Molorchus minor]|uniref:Iron-sulfur clusters transporter ABCB7, mitochondrial n=1 Tax=Molorchus minor TaxID=1323400 RepID=A0ABQ9JLF5_9CUCU|nr:hypothetical protein NQ317_002416 [Molorchus minor]